MNTFRISIIGMGPRGLSVLRRLSELADLLPDVAVLEVHLIDPGDSGQGVHSARQPSHLLTNTIANQVTMFGNGAGPSFTEWANQLGYRKFGREYFPTGDDSGLAVGEHDYLPRAMLGEYLSWVFDHTSRALPECVRLYHARERAVDVEDSGDGRFVVRLERGGEIQSDFVVLATGHCERTPTDDDRAYEQFTQDYAANNHQLMYFSNPYPVDKLQRIAPQSRVAVQGFGLTAYDVISALTIGRGGAFEGEGLDLRYVASGREPKISLFSRQCLPFSARGVNQKGVTGQHRARFFTPEAARMLRRRAGGQLDFDADVLPLLLREMGYAYRMSVEQREIPPHEYEFGPEDRRVIEAIIDPLCGREFADQEEFTKFFLRYVVDDLAQAELGNLAGPLKAATDVIRDTRAALREAVEFAGLTPASHRIFTNRHVPMMNRIAFGPPRRRNAELLALFDAGIVKLAGGPGCRVVADPQTATFAIHSHFGSGHATTHADALVIARLDAFHPELDRSQLVANLLRRDLIRPHRNGEFMPGGIDIDRNGRPITSDGRVLPNAWAIGYLVEGPRFYTYALPRQGLGSQFISDADICVRDILALIKEQVNSAEDNLVRAARRPVPLP